MGNAFDVVLAALLLAVAAWTVITRDGFTSVVAFVTYGLLLALVWVRIAAPDVALTEAAVGGGVTGSLLLSASTRLQRPGPSPPGDQPSLALRASAMTLCILVAAALAGGILVLPYPPPTLAPPATSSLWATGLGNAVAAVLISYRAIDTLLESIALILALVGVWSLSPDNLWGGLPGRKTRLDAGGPLTLLARFLPPVGIVIGLHIFWAGSQAPGGEFQGSAILAAMLILAIMSGLIDAPPISRRWLRGLLGLGPIVFLAAGFAGFLTADGFLAYPPSLAKPLILVIETALMLSIAAMLGLLVAGPPARRERS
jgi:multisubunit Na+/H+ antiporter MnhB subunit